MVCAICGEDKILFDDQSGYWCPLCGDGLPEDMKADYYTEEDPA